jgi:hypothetical protein
MKYFKKKELQPMLDWEPDMAMHFVSISEADKLNGSPKVGDMIAINPKNKCDMWLVASEFVKENYELEYEAED